MSTKHGALVVVGSGPGIGRNVGALFAERGFERIILMSRNASRLEDDAAFVRKVGPAASVETVTVDLLHADHVRRALKEIDRRIDSVALESVLFNAATLRASNMMDFPAEQLEQDLRVSVVSLYRIAQWAMPQLIKTSSNDSGSAASFLVTSGLLYKDPFPAMFSLASCKAVQYNLVHSLYKEYKPRGVHCALVVVGGTVADESKVTNARNIAEEAWKLHIQRKGEGELEVEMLDPDYLEHVKNREQAKRS